MVTLSQAFTSLRYVKKNINNLSGVQKLLMANTVNSLVYDYMKGINSEDLILEKSIFIQADTSSYSVPNDFFSHVGSMNTGIFLSMGGNDFTSLEFDTQTGNFAQGLVLTGGTSGAVGTIDQIEDNGTTGFLKLSSVTGTFVADEIITDSATGSATVNSLQLFSESDTMLPNTNANSLKLGFFQRGSDFIFTPKPTGKTVYLNRYFPTLTAFTNENLTESFIAVNQTDASYTSLLTDLLLVQYETYDQNPLLKQNAILDSINKIKQFFNSTAKSPQVFIFN